MAFLNETVMRLWMRHYKNVKKMRERIGLGQEEANNLEKENRHKNRNTMAREKNREFYE